MNNFIDLLTCGTTPYQAVAWGSNFLEKKGFVELDFKKRFEIEEGGRYFVKPYPSMLFAFVVGKDFKAACFNGLSKARIAMAHTDFPCFKVKSNPEYVTKKYQQVNVEPYGGMLKGTWFDRPLGLAGKVVLESQDAFHPKVEYVDSEEALFVIPSLAPHMDRESNQKRDYDMQQELQPIAGMIREQCEKDGYLMEYLAKKLSVKKEAILAFDLYLYNMDKPETIGLEREFLSAPRIDNLASVAALLEGIKSAHPTQDIVLAACFDNEEIGSRSKQGADSMLMPMVFDKIEEGLWQNGTDRVKMSAKTEETKQPVVEWKGTLREALLRGFLLSVDGAHAIHPNYVGKSDITNEVYLGAGPVIKTSASQRYISDSEGVAIIKQLCRSADIPYQVQVNRSGMPGGQTLGPIVSSYLPMQGADLGVPMLAMHSARELMAVSDFTGLVKFMEYYFEN